MKAERQLPRLRVCDLMCEDVGVALGKDPSYLSLARDFACVFIGRACLMWHLCFFIHIIALDARLGGTTTTDKCTCT